ncbi:MAG: hypothetical protein WBB13_15845, partial [Tabrizicola sp.]
TGAERLELALTPELQARYLGGAKQALYLVRPDQIIAARWVTARPEAITEALTAIWSDRT